MDDLTFREIIRGEFLKALVYDHNHELSDVALKASVWSLDYRITIEQVRHEINYLEDKYVIEKTIKNAKLWMVRLNAKGRDVLEGREEIKGIIIRD